MTDNTKTSDEEKVAFMMWQYENGSSFTEDERRARWEKDIGRDQYLAIARVAIMEIKRQDK